MLMHRRKYADVQIIFVTDEASAAQHLQDALSKSLHRVVFKSLTSCASNLVAILQSVLIDRPFLPTAIIIDYFCSDARCFDILRDIKDAIKQPGVELIVANGPDQGGLPYELFALGADLVIGAEMPFASPVRIH